MRTSRISQDTSKLAASLAAGRARRETRQSAAIRRSALDAGEADRVPSGPERDVGNDELDSGLSSGPEDLAKRRKRKREQPPSPVFASIKREATEILSITEIASPTKANGRSTKVRRVPAKKTVTADGAVKVEPPPNWEEMYALTREMRNENLAPVDTMGCESLADRSASPRDQRFQTLVSLMLSSQTKDTVTSVAVKAMQENMPGVC